MQDRLNMCWQPVQQLSEPGTKAAVQRALEQLAAAEGRRGALATAEQIQYACCKALVRFIHPVLLDYDVASSSGSNQPGMAAASGRTVSQQQRAWMLEVCDRATALMLQLQPTNPNAWELAAHATFTITPGPRGIEMCDRALELAGQQGGLLSRAAAAGLALLCFAIVHANAPMPPSPSVATARMALAMLDGLPAELERNRRLLPALWVAEVEMNIQQAQRFVPAVRAMLAGNPAALRQMPEPPLYPSPMCAGCGRTALGLRACSRCHSTKYCR
jgi:hypothetical protein